MFVDKNGKPLSPKQAYNSLVGQTITLEDGDEITFVKNLPHRNMYNELFRKHPGYDGSFDIVGINETLNKNIIDVFSGSESQTRNDAPKNYHYGVDSFDKRQVYITDGNDVYRLELNIANLSGGQKVAYVKRFIEIAGAEVSEKIKKAETARKHRLNQPSGTSIRNPEPVVNKKFTLSDRVEQTKNLVAVHNLTEDKLLSTLKLGGFPMPSIAVTKSDIPHTNFGEISLVFGRDTIDPKANRKNAVYSADAWTPTFPKVEYEADSNGMSGQACTQEPSTVRSQPMTSHRPMPLTPCAIPTPR